MTAKQTAATAWDNAREPMTMQGIADAVALALDG